MSDVVPLVDVLVQVLHGGDRGGGDRGADLQVHVSGVLEQQVGVVRHDAAVVDRRAADDDLLDRGLARAGLTARRRSSCRGRRPPRPRPGSRRTDGGRAEEEAPPGAGRARLGCTNPNTLSAALIYSIRVMVTQCRNSKTAVAKREGLRVILLIRTRVRVNKTKSVS